MNRQSATAIQRGIAAVDAQHLNNLKERWENTARGDGLFPEEAIEIAAPLADAWCDLTWKPGPPPLDVPGMFLVQFTKSIRGWLICHGGESSEIFFDDCGSVLQDEPDRIARYMQMALWHFPIPSPPSGDSE